MKTIEWENVLRGNQRKACKAMFYLGGGYRNTGQFAEAESCFTEAEILAEKAQDEELRVAAKLWRGNLYYHSGRFHEALKIFRGLIPIYEQMGIDPEGVRSYHLRKTLLAVGDYTGCLDQTSTRLAGLPNRISTKIRCSVESGNLVGLLYNGLLAEAWKHVKRLLVLQERDLESPFVYIVVWLALARAYMDLGMFQESKRYCLKVLGVAEVQGHVPHQATAVVILSYIENPQEGRRVVKDLKMVDNRLNGVHEDITPHIGVKIALGQALLNLDRPDEAKELAQTAWKMLEQHSRFPELLDCIVMEARCNMLLSNWSEVSRLVTMAEEYENKIRAKNLSLSVPLLTAQMWQEHGDRQRSDLALNVANERYEALASGLPKHVRGTLCRRRDVKRLFEMRQCNLAIPKE